MRLLILIIGVGFFHSIAAEYLSTYRDCIDYLVKHGWIGSKGQKRFAIQKIAQKEEKELAMFLKGPILQMQSYYHLEETGLCNNETLGFMRKWRCGSSDTHEMRSKNTVRRKRWAALYDIPLWNNPVNGIPFPLTIGFKNYHPNMTQADQDEALLHCATIWAEASSISFSFVGQQSTANIFISFIESIEGDDGEGGVLALAESPTPFRDPPQSNIQFDARESWVAKWTPDQSAERKSFQAVLCHEIGHSLALGHSKVRSALMFGELLSQQREAALDQDDRDGIQSLYGPPNDLVIVNTTSTSTSSLLAETTVLDEQTSTVLSTRQTSTTPVNRPRRCTNGRRRLQRRNCSGSRQRSRT